MSLHKPSEAEDEYIAREEAARHQREAIELSHRMEAQEQERLKRLHYMKCPKCGFDLKETLFRGVMIDKCYHCNGMWLDEHEAEVVAGHSDNIFHTIVKLFRRI